MTAEPVIAGSEPSRIRRYVLTGAPGTGKTTIARVLQARGYAVIDEAATDVIARRQAAGSSEPWLDPEFLDLITAVQRERQQAAAPDGRLQVYDRSPLCTLALARYLRRSVTPPLAAEIERVQREGIYQRQVFLVQPIGFVQATAARRISLAESLVFARIHQEVYTEHGYDLTEIPAADASARASMIEQHMMR